MTRRRRGRNCECQGEPTVREAHDHACGSPGCWEPFSCSICESCSEHCLCEMDNLSDMELDDQTFIWE